MSRRHQPTNSARLCGKLWKIASLDNFRDANLLRLKDEIIYFTVARAGWWGLTLLWSWPHALGSALANAFLAVALFAVLDKFKQRT